MSFCKIPVIYRYIGCSNEKIQNVEKKKKKFKFKYIVWDNVLRRRTRLECPRGFARAHASVLESGEMRQYCVPASWCGGDMRTSWCSDSQILRLMSIEVLSDFSVHQTIIRQFAAPQSSNFYMMSSCTLSCQISETQNWQLVSSMCGRISMIMPDIPIAFFHVSLIWHILNFTVCLLLHIVPFQLNTPNTHTHIYV